jgi:hypothetical protein
MNSKINVCLAAILAALWVSARQGLAQNNDQPDTSVEAVDTPSSVDSDATPSFAPADDQSVGESSYQVGISAGTVVGIDPTPQVEPGDDSGGSCTVELLPTFPIEVPVCVPSPDEGPEVQPDTAEEAPEIEEHPEPPPVAEGPP